VGETWGGGGHGMGMRHSDWSWGGLVSMSKGIHVHGGYTWAWGAHGHMVTWVYEVGFNLDVNSCARVQWADTTCSR
jgi:hypothetical protein